MIPSAEHWRVSLAQAQTLQHDIMGYLPGFATPRIVCDVPYVGKRWVHQVAEYDRERGISYWTKNYRTGIERTDEAALDRRYTYYDPIATLPRERAGVVGRAGARPGGRRAERQGGGGVATARCAGVPGRPPGDLARDAAEHLRTERLQPVPGRRPRGPRPADRPLRARRRRLTGWSRGRARARWAAVRDSTSGRLLGDRAARLVAGRCCSSRCPTVSARWRSAGTCTPTRGATGTRPRPPGRSSTGGSPPACRGLRRRPPGPGVSAAAHAGACRAARRRRRWADGAGYGRAERVVGGVVEGRRQRRRATGPFGQLRAASAFAAWPAARSASLSGGLLRGGGGAAEVDGQPPAVVGAGGWSG